MKEIKPVHMFRDTFVNVCNLCSNFSVDRTNTDVIRQLCLCFRSFFQSHLGKGREEQGQQRHKVLRPPMLSCHCPTVPQPFQL